MIAQAALCGIRRGTWRQCRTHEGDLCLSARVATNRHRGARAARNGPRPRWAWVSRSSELGEGRTAPTTRYAVAALPTRACRNTPASACRWLGEDPDGSGQDCALQAWASGRAAPSVSSRPSPPSNSLARIHARARAAAWAATQMNLGAALQRLGERENSTEHLVQAVAAYQARLQEYTRERAPLLGP